MRALCISCVVKTPENFLDATLAYYGVCHVWHEYIALGSHGDRDGAQRRKHRHSSLRNVHGLGAELGSWTIFVPVSKSAPAFRLEDDIKKRLS